MKALVVYESLWGNTAAVAAIAESLGAEARALSTADAVGPALADADLIVAGSPVLAFKLPSEKIRESLRTTPPGAAAPADLSHPSMSAWLEALPGRPRPLGRLRHAGTRPLRQRRAGDRQGAGARRLPVDRQAGRLRCEGQVRTAARRRAGAGPSVGSGAR